MQEQRGCSESVKAPLSMILVQLFTVGMFLLSKVVLSRGTFVYALLTYRNVIGAFFVAPFAFFLEREMRRKLNWRVMMWIFMNALFGISVALVLYYYGLKDTTAAFSSNFLNLIPIVTFIFAVVARMEKLGLDSRAGKVKLVGTLLCVGGAMVVSLYKGKALHIWPTNLAEHHTFAKEGEAHNWLRGTLLLLCSCVGYACWFLVQAKLFRVFPSKYWTTMLTCIAGCFQTVVLGVSINRQKEAWRLQWDLQLLTIVYSGVFNTGATFCLVSWAISKRGPTYPSMFNSLAVITTTLLESLFMGQNITSGSLLGMFMIIGGLYAFLWGKGKEIAAPQRVGDVTLASDSEHSLPNKDSISIDVNVKASDSQHESIAQNEMQHKPTN